MENCVSGFCADILFRILQEMPIRLSVVQNLFIDYCNKHDYPLDGDEELILEILKKGCVYFMLGKLYYQEKDEEENNYSECSDNCSDLETESESPATKVKLEIFHKRKNVKK